jgi:hypothetical protein
MTRNKGNQNPNYGSGDTMQIVRIGNMEKTTGEIMIGEIIMNCRR